MNGLGTGPSSGSGAEALTSQSAEHKKLVLHGYDDAMIRLSDQAIDWLVRLQSDSVSDQDRAEFNAWCAQSKAHARAVSDAQALFFGVDETSSAQEWSGMHDRLKPSPVVASAASRSSRFVRPSPISAKSGRMIARRITYIAASFCTVLAIVIAGTIGNGNPWVRWHADYATGVGEFETVALPDGTIAHLNTASAFSIDFSGNDRRIELSVGEVIFDVAKDVEHPFIVTASGGEAMAVGTVYGVRIDDEQVDVTVQEGIVEVRSETGNAIRLTAGEQGFYRSGDAPDVYKDADISTYGSWQRGKLIFNSRALGDVIDEVQRYKNEKIIIARDSLRDLKVTGVFETTNLDDLLNSLEQTVGATVVRLPLLTVIY